MKKGNVHIEGAKCVKKAQVAIDELQICPKSMQSAYVFRIVDTVISEAYNYWRAKNYSRSLSDTLREYEDVYRWVLNDMARQGCSFYPDPSQYKCTLRYMGGVLMNL